MNYLMANSFKLLKSNNKYDIIFITEVSPEPVTAGIL